MEQTIQKTLQRWESSLITFGKIDSWKIEADYHLLGEYILMCRSTSKKNAVRNCRDYAINNAYDSAILLDKVQYANQMVGVDDSHKNNRKYYKERTGGQARKYEGVTQKLFQEKLRFMDGKRLRNVDISITDGSTSRKVRRIVEKRMCQAYHKQNHQRSENGNRDRHYMKRATSFQLHNLGQIENVINTCRTESTHWKRTYDPITGEVVFKKKVEYSTYEEAAEAAKEFMERHPKDLRPVEAYRCAMCGHYHIGHRSEDSKHVEFIGSAL